MCPQQCVLVCQHLYSRVKTPHKKFLSEDLSVNRMYLGYLEKYETEVFKRNQETLRYTIKYGFSCLMYKNNNIHLIAGTSRNSNYY